MIHRILVRKNVEQAALLWFGCGAALFAFCWVRVWVVSLLDMSRFRTIVEQFREFERFAPIKFDQLFTYAGRIGMTFDEPVVVFCIVVWAIARGSDAVSGELGRGTLEMILAQPISRTRYLVSHAVVSVAGLAGLTLLIWLGIWIGVQLTSVEETVPPPALVVPWVNVTIPLSVAEPEKVVIAMRDEIDCGVFLGSCVNVFAFGYFLLALTTWLSSIDRYRWRTIGVVITIYVFELVVFGLGKAAERLQFLTHCSFFDLYRPQPISRAAIEHGWLGQWSLVPMDDDLVLGPALFTLLLLVLGTLFYAAAVRTFIKRDLPAPL